MSRPEEEVTLRGLLCRREWWQRWSRELGWAFLWSLVVAGLWITNSGLWVSEAWHLPAIYGGDGLQILGWIKGAAEGDYHVFGMSFISRLGAPFEANWNDYPMYEKPFTVLLGYVARVGGLYLAANLGMLLTHMTATIGFYLAARWFRWERWWCGVGAVVFGLQFYLSFRGQGHLLLALTYTLPFALLTTWLVSASRRMSRWSPNWGLCLTVDFVMGASSPYFLYLHLQLMALAMVTQWLRDARRDNLEAGVATMAAAAAGFLSVHTGMLLTRLFAGTNAMAVKRHYGDAEIFALRPMEMFLPPAGHRSDIFGRIGTEYQNVLTYVQPESGSPYLGIVGALLALAMVIQVLRGVARRQRTAGLLPFWQAIWILLFSVVGGGNALLFLFGVDTFRASNRNSVFIATAVLLWAVPRAARLTRGWRHPFQILLGGGVIMLAAWDQLPPNPRADNAKVVAAKVAADRSFVDQLESRLPKGATVFQLPVVKFPEARLVSELDPYDHLRLYLNGSKMRLSFGSNKGRMDAAWQLNVERLPPRDMIRRLESFGFHALVIDRGDLPHNGDALLQALAEIGYQPVPETGHPEFTAIRLRPTDQPLVPALNEFPFLDLDDGWERHDIGPDETHWRILNEARLRLNPSLPPGSRMRLSMDVKLPRSGLLQVYLGGEVLVSELQEGGEVRNLRVQFDRPERELVLTVAARSPDNSGKLDELLTFRSLALEVVERP
jgi:hypothetical protein